MNAVDVQRIIKTEIIYPAKERTVDWGPRQRGQGKRIGAGMVIGSMSDAPTGIKTYFDRTANLPDIEVVRPDISILDYDMVTLYLKARSAGYSHLESFRFSLEFEGI